MQTSTNHTSFLSTGAASSTLALVCFAGFLDFVDTTIVNVALPSIRHGLGFSVANLQWVISGYLLTYGGCCSSVAAQPICLAAAGYLWPGRRCSPCPP